MCAYWKTVKPEHAVYDFQWRKDPKGVEDRLRCCSNEIDGEKHGYRHFFVVCPSCGLLQCRSSENRDSSYGDTVFEVDEPSSMDRTAFCESCMELATSNPAMYRLIHEAIHHHVLKMKDRGDI